MTFKPFLITLEGHVQSVMRKTDQNFPEHILNKQKGKMQRERCLENGKKSEKRKDVIKSIFRIN